MDRPGPLSKKRKIDQQQSRPSYSSDVIEILDENSEDDDSSSNSNPRETRNRTVKGFRMRKLEELRVEGGISEFNPEKSQREKRKISKVVQATQEAAVAVPPPPGPTLPPVQRPKRGWRSGIMRTKTGQDTCDCLDDDCPGCFFACHKCSSTKCALTCRRRRTWYYDKVTIDGQIASKVAMSINDLLTGWQSD